MRRGIWLDTSRIFLLVRVACRYLGYPAMAHILGLRDRGLPVEVRVRKTFEELGLTYLKLGQYLSTRFDVLPAALCQEMNKLLEQVAPVPFVQAKAIIESELQAPLGSIFKRFKQIPLAAASVAQVYEAVTFDGLRVAVKVQRPNLEEIFDSDIRNLRRVAWFVEKSGWTGSLPIVEIVDTFAAWTRFELDFRVEGATADRLRRDAIEDEVIPRVEWGLTTKRVLTLEFIEGVSLARIMDLLEQDRIPEVKALLPGLDIKRIGHLLTKACLTQFFTTGFFHGDPHPGNILLLSGNRIAFVDFGIFGELSDYLRLALLGHIKYISVGNIELSFRYYAMQVIPTSESDMQGFTREGKEALRRWYVASRDPWAEAKDRHIGKVSAEIFGIVRRNHIGMSSETLLFWRAMNVLASTAVRLPEYFDLFAEMREFFMETQPGPLEETLATLEDPGLVAGMFDMPRQLLMTFRQSGGNRAGAIGTWRAGASRADQHTKNDLVKSVAGAIISIALAIGALRLCQH